MIQRHVGKHNNQPLIVIFRQLPGEEHMALVVYTSTLPDAINEPLMKAIESDAAQTTIDVADVLNRTMTKNGVPMLQELHRTGRLKKVQTDSIVMTPNRATQIKLSELNRMLDEIAKGEEATKRLAEADAARGLQTPAEVAARKEPKKQTTQVQPTVTVNEPEVEVSEDDITAMLLRQAEELREQATKMLDKADSLVWMAQSHMQEDQDHPFQDDEQITTDSLQVEAGVVKRGRGRPRKIVA